MFLFSTDATCIRAFHGRAGWKDRRLGSTARSGSLETGCYFPSRLDLTMTADCGTAPFAATSANTGVCFEIKLPEFPPTL